VFRSPFPVLSGIGLPCMLQRVTAELKPLSCCSLPTLTSTRKIACTIPFLCMRLFLKRDSNFRFSPRERTPLRWAAGFGHLEACRVLISAKADAAAKDKCAMRFRWPYALMKMVRISHNFLKVRSDAPAIGHRAKPNRCGGISARRWRCRMRKEY
jgi:hypothetical protein